jgi:hypothetical protein
MTMLAAKNLIVSALLTMALPAMAGTTLLDFEGVSATRTALTVNNPYAALGIGFTANSYSAASNKALVNPGDAYFYRGLDANGKTANRGALVLWDGRTDTGVFSFYMNVAQGFDTSFGLSYTSGASGTVQIFSGENGSGDLISDLGLVRSKTCAADTRYLCEWSDANIDLKGQVGRSIRFTGQNTQLIFDDLKLQLHEDPTNPIPEPGGLALSLAALGALVWGRKRTAL